MSENSFIDQLAGVINYSRKKKNLSRVELAHLAGVGKTILFDIEHGKKSIRLDTLIKILTALELKLELTGQEIEDHPQADK